MDKEALLDRFSGSLLGLAVGDATGSPADDLSPYEAARKLGFLDGYFAGRREEGMYSSPSQLAATIALAMIATGGRLTKDEVARQHVLALPKARGWHDDTTSAIERLKAGTPYDDCGSASTDGEFLPKAVPIGLLAAAKDTPDESLLRICESVTSLTHKGLGPATAAFVVAKIVRDCVRRDFGGTDCLGNPFELYQGEESLLARIVSFCRVAEHGAPQRESVAERLEYTRKRLQDGTKLDAFMGRSGNSRLYVEALCFSVFCFFREYDEFRAVSRAASCGRAASLNAALVGAMGGAYVGAGRYVPKDARDDLEGSQRFVILAEQLLEKACKEAK